MRSSGKVFPISTFRSQGSVVIPRDSSPTSDLRETRGNQPFSSSITRRQWLIASAYAACAIPITGFGQTFLSQAQPPSPAASIPIPLAENFRFDDEKQKPRQLLGRAMLEGEDGSLLVQGVDSQIWRISNTNLKARSPSNQPFTPISKADLGIQLTQEMGLGFNSHETEHYVMCTNASAPYIRWCGAVLERLNTAFRTYWSHPDRGCNTFAPKFPLVALIFEKQAEFARFATGDVGPDTATVPGYFSILTNRIVLYDLAFDTRRQRATSVAEVEQRVGAASYNVATMIHEATHQIAFNCGLHTRLADNPVWLTEGMATYFETPDLKSKTGWKTAGQLNKSRLKRFKDFLAKRRDPESLVLLIRNDARLTNPETAEDAYAESWALTYFLIRKKPKEYVKFLDFLAAKKPLDYPTPDQRMAEFFAIFGDIKALDGEFLRYIRSVK